MEMGDVDVSKANTNTQRRKAGNSGFSIRTERPTHKLNRFDKEELQTFSGAGEDRPNSLGLGEKGKALLEEENKKSRKGT